MRAHISRAIAVVAAGVFVLGVASTQTMAQNTMSSLAKESQLEVIKKRGTFRVGMTSFVPWAMRDKKGELIGFEIDVANEVASDMGVELELIPTQFAGIIPALLAGTFDTIITGIAHTPKRNLQVNFTIPYQTYGSMLIVSRKLAPNVKTIADLNDPGIRIASRRGGTGSKMLARVFPKAKVLLFDDDAQVYQDVINGNVHATSSPKPKPEFYAKAYPDSLYMPVEGFLPGSKQNSGFAIRKGDPDFLNFLDNWILHHQTNGWLPERNSFWFNSDNWFDQVEAGKNPYALKK